MLGLQHGDTVGIIAPSSSRWDIVQFAALSVGGVVVGLDPNETSERLATVASQCRLKAVIAKDEHALDRLGPACRAALRFAVTFATPPGAGTVAYSDLASMGSAAAGGAGGADRAVRAEDQALIVYTSGTTGEPKGIAYSHRQVCSAVASILNAFPDIGAGSRLACWLPLSNLFQRMINLCAVGRGAQVYYVEDPRTIMELVPSIAPTLFIGVPRFYEKLYEGIRSAIDGKPAWQRRVMDWAIRAGDRQARAQRNGDVLGSSARLKAFLAERAVLRRIRGVLGGDLRYLVSGSAPMPPWLLERFHALGLLVLEAYGLSESIVPVSVNRPDSYRFGTVGQPLTGNEVRIGADGELLIRSAGVFNGYLGEAAGSAHIDPDGFLASGDFARIDNDGYVTLLGRKSEMFKTSTGRRIAPAGIENLLRQLPYVEQAVVFGANRPFPVAVIAVAEAALRNRLGGRDWKGDVPATAATVSADFASVLAELPGYQHPAGLVLTIRPFTVADGLITPNLKVRRPNVEAAFGDCIEELFRTIGHGKAQPSALLLESANAIVMST